MTAKEYLSQAYRMNEIIESDKEEINRLREIATGITAPMDGDRVMGGEQRNKIEACVLRITELQGRYADEIQDMLAMKAEILTALQQVENRTDQLILRLRYINFHSWDEIREISGIEDPFQVHDRALQRFSVPNTSKYQ